MTFHGTDRWSHAEIISDVFRLSSLIYGWVKFRSFVLTKVPQNNALRLFGHDGKKMLHLLSSHKLRKTKRVVKLG